MKKRIKVGFDFDGVVAYNPFRLVRAPWAFFKRRVLRMEKLTFFYPKNRLEKLVWKIMHDSSILPAKGTELLREMIDENLLEAHLISGRYSFLDHHLYDWLERYGMKKFFKSINFNRGDIQPHLFKERMIRDLGVSVFIEDNWDIVDYLSRFRKTTVGEMKIFWIYNIFDRFRNYDYKYPYLERALIELKNQINNKKNKR